MLILIVPSGQGAFGVEGFVVSPALERARELVKSKKPADALEALSSYSPSHEEFSAYHYAYAQALVQLNQRYESIEHYRLAYLYAGSEGDKERTLFKRAEVYAEMGYFSEAVVCFDVFLKQFPKTALSTQAELGIAESRVRLGEFREALAHYEKAGTSLRARYGKANALQSLGRTKEAYDIYRDLIENDPEIINSSQETLYNIGENYRQTGKLGDAKVYLTSVKDFVLKYRAAIGLGQIAMQEGRLDAAVTYFTTAADSPERAVRSEAIMYRADTHMREGKYDEARSALLEIRSAYPYGRRYDAATLLLAKLYREQGKFNESTDLLKTLIYQRTPSSAALDELEAIMLKVKDRDRDTFVKLWNAAGRWLLDPSRTASIMKIAQGLRYSGKPFLDVCSWLIRYGPEDARTEGRLLLADFYADMGDASAAWGYLERTRIKGHSDDVLRIKAKAYMANHDPMNASQAIMSLHEIREADMLMLLDAMKSLKTIEKAAEFCKRMFEKMPASARIAVRFADILYDAGKTEDALEYYRTAVSTKSGAAGGAAADTEWAHYRISMLTRGEESVASLKTIQTGKNPMGRLAAAELKSAALRRMARQVN